jgi:transcriptional regulator with XRE-family HTH domain
MPNFDENIDYEPTEASAPEKPPHYIGPWRRAARPKITGERLAEQLEVTKGTISDWENYRYMPNLMQLHRIADALGISIGWLLQYHPDDVNPDVLAAWSNVPDADRPRALEAIKIFERKDGTNG